MSTDSAEFVWESVEETFIPGFISSWSLSHKFSRSAINSLKLMKPVLFLITTHSLFTSCRNKTSSAPLLKTFLARHEPARVALVEHACQM